MGILRANNKTKGKKTYSRRRMFERIKSKLRLTSRLKTCGITSARVKGDANTPMRLMRHNGLKHHNQVHGALHDSMRDALSGSARIRESWWRWAESNRRRRGYEPRALTN
jgi:hypothetical protein